MYNTPNTPGGTLISIKPIIKFRLDLDIYNGLHYHFGTGASGKVHNIIVPWVFGPK